MTCGSREERRVTAWWPEKLGVIPASGLTVTRAPEIGPACVRASMTLLNGSEEHRPTRWHPQGATIKPWANYRSKRARLTGPRRINGLRCRHRPSWPNTPRSAANAHSRARPLRMPSPSRATSAQATRRPSTCGLRRALRRPEQTRLHRRQGRAGQGRNRVITRGRANTIPPTGRSAQPDSRFLP
jgi:hypothetical protein